VDQTTWLSSIVLVSKKLGKSHICIDFCKLNSTTKKDPYPLLFTKEVLDAIARHDIYLFLD
jgi:hypothetical protein